MSAQRERPARKDAVEMLDEAWKQATPRERAVWITEALSDNLSRIKQTCASLLPDGQNDRRAS